MSKVQQTARGVIWNWIALVFGFGVAFVMAPFIVHRLGMVTYGVWSLIVSTTSYMALLDLGLRGAVIRFVSSNRVMGKHAEASRAVAGALWLRQWIGLSIVGLSVLAAFLINRLFSIPVETRDAARWAITLTGLGVGFALFFGVFSGVLAALHRFDVLSKISITQTILRALGVLWVLKSGFGILGLGALELALATVTGLSQVYFALASYPELRISLRFPGKDILKAFAGYSIWIFLTHIFGQIIYYTDNLVVGAFVSVAAVAFYSIGGSLIEYIRNVVQSITNTFMPLASSYEASDEHEKLRLLLINGTRFTLIAVLPMQIALFFRGETFLNLWMGPQYGPVSGRVLQILLLAQVFTLANATSMNITFGLAKHKPFAIWLAAEAIANLSLSIFLARRIGIYGVAIGTIIPTLFVQIVLWPRYISRIVDVRLRHYLLQGWALPAVAAIPFGLACYLTDRHWPAASLFKFFFQIALILPAYLVVVAIVFRRDLAELLKARRRLAGGPAYAATAETGLANGASAKPKVSIGLVVYNGERFIAQTLDSLLSQTFSDFEIIISDNGSEDRTQEICRDYARRDERIRYYRNPTNLGLSWNSNRVLELASGKYFKYSAHDDLYAPQFVERCVAVLDQHQDVILAYPKTKLLDDASGRLSEYEDRLDLRSPRASERFGQLLGNMRLCNVIFGLTRTADLRKTAGYSTCPGADIVLMAELSLRGKFYEVPEFLFYRRLHATASSSMKNNDQLTRYLEPAVAKQERATAREWRQLSRHLRSILCTPLPIEERARLLRMLLLMMVWSRKKLAAELGEIGLRNWTRFLRRLREGL